MGAYVRSCVVLLHVCVCVRACMYIRMYMYTSVQSWVVLLFVCVCMQHVCMCTRMIRMRICMLILYMQMHMYTDR
jgi:hypothetical protein